MKVAHIAPPHGTNWIRDKSYHLVVAPRLSQDYAYVSFWKQRHLRGDFIIIDNGEVEFALSDEIKERMPFEQIILLADEIGADEICMPDVFYDGVATIQRTSKWLPYVPIRRRMLIPQGNSLNEWMECAKVMFKWGCRSMGIPKHMERFRGVVFPTRDVEDPKFDGTLGGRYWLCLRIEELGWHKIIDFHLLGVWDNAKTEIQPIARDFPWVRGIDTGIAFAYAQRGMHIHKYAGIHVGLEWDKKFNDRIVEFNIQELEKWAHG